MNIFQKMVQKYGTDRETILPPPPETEGVGVEEKIPSTHKLSPFLSQFVLEEGEDALDPKTFEEYEPEETSWRQNKFPKEIEDNFQEVQKDLSQDAYEVPKAAPEISTIPPRRKGASYNSDHIMRLCKQYHDLCCKL